MGQRHSLLKEHGYALERESVNGSIATKDGERFLITNIKGSKCWKLSTEIETLQKTPHPHIINITGTLEGDKETAQESFHLVTKYCEGGNLAEKIKQRRFTESEALSWIVEICIALKTIHQQNLLHENVTPENILFTEFGKVCLGGFWKPDHRDTKAGISGVHYLPPEVFEEAPYEAKSEIWSLGCILYQLCTQQAPFSAETTSSLITKIRSDPVPSLAEGFSEEFHELYNDMLNKDPALRPTAKEILTRPIIVRSLQEKSQTTVKYLQTQLDKLKEVADSLENNHRRTTIVSLTGGVIAAAGGITTILGRVLAPFYFGIMVILCWIWVGVVVGEIGGLTAGSSNIKNMLNQSSSSKAVQSIIKEFGEKVNAVTIWTQEIGRGLQNSGECSPSALSTEMESRSPGERQRQAGRLGEGLGSITAEVMRHVIVTDRRGVTAQVTRTLRLLEIFSGFLSLLFLGLEFFFITQDAKEIHKIRQTTENRETTSMILKYVQIIRKSAGELQGVLDELKETTRYTEDETELDCEHLKLV